MTYTATSGQYTHFCEKPYILNSVCENMQNNVNTI